MQKAVIIFAFICVPLFFFAQKSPIKFGKISSEEKTMTQSPINPEAGGVVLCDYGKIDFDIFPDGLGFRFTKHKRVKIFKRSAFDEADVAIYYHSKYQKLSKIKVKVYSPNGNVKELSKADFFDEKIEGNWKARKFATPNIEEGSILEYKYDLVSRNLTSLRPWYFQGSLPTLHSELRVETPEVFKYNKVFQGYGSVTTADCDSKLENFIEGGQLKVDVCQYVAKNLEGLREEAYISTMDNYYFNIRFQLEKIRIPGNFKNYSGDWGKVAKNLTKSPSIGAQFLKQKNYNELLNVMRSKFSSSGEKTIEEVSRYLLRNIELKPYSRYSNFSDKSLNDAFVKKKASRAERNMMLLAMLKANNMDANPVYISTRRHGRLLTNEPIAWQFDHLLVQVKLDDKTLLLDLADVNQPAYLLDKGSLNKKGLLVKGDLYDWVDIVPEKSKSTILANLALSDKGEFLGDFSCVEKSYAAAESRKFIAKLDKEIENFWVEKFQKSMPSATVADFKIEEKEVINKPLKTTFNLNVEDAAQISDGMIYFNPVVYSDFFENPFKLEKRSFPVEFSHPVSEQLVINFSLPAGYKIEELPESVSLVLPNDGAKFKFMVSESKKGIRIISKVDIKQLTFVPEEYVSLKNFWDLIIQKMGEQVVLKKV